MCNLFKPSCCAEGRVEAIATMLKAGVAVEVLAKSFGLTESECIQLIRE